MAENKNKQTPRPDWTPSYSSRVMAEARFANGRYGNNTPIVAQLDRIIELLETAAQQRDLAFLRRLLEEVPNEA